MTFEISIRTLPRIRDFAAHYTSGMPPGGGDDGRGPRGAVEADYRRLATLLREIAEKKFRVPSGDAEALVNDVFIAYLLRTESVRNPEKWLVGAICHASRGYWRRAARTEPMSRDLPERPDPDSLDAEDHLIARLTVALALSHLRERCRRVLRMYYLDGYSIAELAERLHTTPGYAAQILHQCRRRLRQIYRRLARERRR
jgi:RNA polymerase sigma factor (sigma-70 family)